MLFREFNIIAAVAYAAQRAANAMGWPEWSEIDEPSQGVHVQQVMAIARGDLVVNEAGEVDVFTATTQALLAQGDGLPLERIHALGAELIDLDLVSVEEAEKGGDIVGYAIELLRELAEKRVNGNAAGALGDDPYTLRANALSSAVIHFQRSFNAGKKAEPVADMARVFLVFMEKPTERGWLRSNALHHAVELADAGTRAATIVLMAEDFYQMLEPHVRTDAELSKLDGEREDATVQ